jgi:hypothetical protein
LVVVRIEYRQAAFCAVLMQLPPGALIVISRADVGEADLVPMWRRPATPITPAQSAGMLTEWPALLPADATTTAAAALTARPRRGRPEPTMLRRTRRRRRGSC